MRRQLGILAAVPALVTIGLAAPAHATAPLENRAPYAGSNEFSDCGDNGHSTYWGDETILDTNPALAGLFDTGGDGAPGGNVLDEQIYRLSGPHPTFAGTFDFCGLVSSQVG